MVVMTIVMIIVVSTFSEIVKKVEVSNILKREMAKSRKYVYKIDNGYRFKKNYNQEDEEIYFIIINSNGYIIDGSYPNNFPMNTLPILKKEVYSVYSIENEKGEQFFIYEQRLGKMEQDTFLRSVLPEKNVSSSYQNLIYVVFIGIVITFIIVLFFGIQMSKHVSNSLKDIQKTAEQISNNLNMSQRMKYNGDLYELQLLINAENSMLDKMEEVFSQQEQFVSDVAHELRTPASVIRAQCEYITSSPKNMLELQEAFEVIDRQSKRMNGIVEQLLELSRLEQKNFHLECEKISLVEIIQCICDDIQEKEEFANKSEWHIEIIQNLEEVHIMGNVYLVSIAIQNLIQNAIKFSNKNGIITISTKQDTPFVFVTVEDNGKGMTSEEQSHIFERFYKADESRNTQGFGLGLALTRKIMEVHNGNIFVESTIGIGSKFTLCFPICD